MKFLAFIILHISSVPYHLYIIKQNEIPAALH